MPLKSGNLAIKDETPQLSISMSTPNRPCILLFSGGRDSTISALRLASRFDRLTLLTVTSEHLSGIQAVKQRLFELRKHLPSSTRWIQISQPRPKTPTSLIAATCLPCHRAYITCGVCLATISKISDLALGYTSYQSDWPEQTKNATNRLRSLLHKIGINLQLPVYDLISKESARQELENHGLPPIAMEQKCSKQINNIELETSLLSRELAAWEHSVDSEIKKTSWSEINVLDDITIGQLRGI